MQLTRHTDYALRLLIYAARSTDPAVSVQSVAQAYNISAHHLAKVAQKLIRLGYLRGVRGRGGGLQLVRRPPDICIGAVVRGTEQTLALVECFEPACRCAIEPVCGLKHALREAQQAFFAVLDRYTLDDLLRKPAQLDRLLGIVRRPEREAIGKRSATAHQNRS
ncbi:MAG: Rrf2 family transcriptional regulator [Pseudomonadota bacterium]|nr:Rrf2 family transcriptional regulator [Pseudomonadota bacterium]